MGQSELLAAALAGGFLLYLAAKGRLATYWSLMTGGTGAAASTGTAGGQATAAGPTAASVVSGAGTAATALTDLSGAAPSILSPSPASIADFFGGGAYGAGPFGSQ